MGEHGPFESPWRVPSHGRVCRQDQGPDRQPGDTRAVSRHLTNAPHGPAEDGWRKCNDGPCNDGPCADGAGSSASGRCAISALSGSADRVGPGSGTKLQGPATDHDRNQCGGCDLPGVSLKSPIRCIPTHGGSRRSHQGPREVGARPKRTYTSFSVSGDASGSSRRGRRQRPPPAGHAADGCALRQHRARETPCRTDG